MGGLEAKLGTQTALMGQTVEDLAGVVIEVTGLKKAFGLHEVLCGIDLSVRRGEVVTIIGPSGSGKSTFLRCLNLLGDSDRRLGPSTWHGVDRSAS